MATIKNPHAYCKRVIMNSLKNEYRQNDNAYKHISPVGDKIFLLMDREVPESEWERMISEKNPRLWLAFIENEKLFFALNSLADDDLYLVFVLFVRQMTQREAADYLGITQQAVSKRWAQLKNFFQKSLNLVVEKCP